MAFEWPAFFNQYGVDYLEQGANVSRDNVVVHCPFCGPADEGHHMSVNLVGKGWRCFRRPDHRGKNPVRLVRALLNCTHDAAANIVGTSVFLPNDFMGRIASALAPPEPEVERKPLRMPSVFKSFARTGAALPSSRIYYQYLRDRGFHNPDVLDIEYGLRYCTSGPYRGRIVFPVNRGGRLVGWTGRTVSKAEQLRYKTLSDDAERAEREGVEPALGPITNYLLFEDQLERWRECNTLVLCEGPFDALKVFELGYKHGIAATCFFTASPSAMQVERLHELLPRFDRCFLMLDEGTLATALRVLWRMLPDSGIKPVTLPSSVKDPGDLKTSAQLLRIVV